MPIYEYQCKKCGQFEIMQKITDTPLKRCPTCRNKVSKLISNSSFHLKGTGWYATDYARKGETSNEKANDTSAESKSDSKAVKSETGKSEPAKSETSEKKPMKPDSKASTSKTAAAA